MLLETGFETQNLNDIYSRAGTILTLLIAFKALMVGKNYTDKMMVEEGYKKAVFLKDDILTKLDSQYFSRFYLSNANGFIKSLTKHRSSPEITSITLKNLTQYSKELKRHAHHLDSFLSDFERAINSTKTYGLILSPKYSVILHDLVNNAEVVSEMLSSSARAIESITETFYVRGSDKEEERNLIPNFNDITLNENSHELISFFKCTEDAEEKLSILDESIDNSQIIKQVNIKAIFS